MKYLWIWALFTSLFNFSLAVFVLSNAPKKKVNILWSLFCLTVGIWSMGFAMMIHLESFDVANAWVNRVVYPFSILIPVVFLHFAEKLTQLGSKAILATAYALAMVELFLNSKGLFGTLAATPPFTYYV